MHLQLSISSEQVWVSRGNRLRSMLHMAVTVTLQGGKSQHHKEIKHSCHATLSSKDDGRMYIFVHLPSLCKQQMIPTARNTTAYWVSVIVGWLHTVTPASKVPTAVPLDYRAASFLRLHHSTLPPTPTITAEFFFFFLCSTQRLQLAFKCAVWEY